MESLKHIIITFVVSAIPIMEQKFAIPYGMHMGIGTVPTFLLTLAGAFLPAPFILLFVPALFKFMKRYKVLNKFVTWYEKRSLKKGKNIVKYELFGLFTFVAIPLPLTGVWTGAVVASLLKLDFKKSLVSIFFGAMACGLLIMLVYKGVLGFLFWL